MKFDKKAIIAGIISGGLATGVLIGVMFGATHKQETVVIGSPLLTGVIVGFITGFIAVIILNFIRKH